MKVKSWGQQPVLEHGKKDSGSWGCDNNKHMICHLFVFFGCVYGT